MTSVVVIDHRARPALDDDGRPAHEDAERVMRSVRTALAMGSNIMLPVDDALPALFPRPHVPNHGHQLSRTRANLFSSTPLRRLQYLQRLWTGGSLPGAHIPDGSKNRAKRPGATGGPETGWTRTVVEATLVAADIRLESHLMRWTRPRCRAFCTAPINP